MFRKRRFERYWMNFGGKDELPRLTRFSNVGWVESSRPHTHQLKLPN